MKKLMRVTCGVIEQEGRFLVVQRPENTRHALKWEFPGGKIDPGESEAECMARELKEELDIHVSVHQRLEPIFREDGEYMVELIPFHCRIEEGQITLLEHLQLHWLDIHLPIEIELCAGDYFIVDQLIENRR